MDNQRLPNFLIVGTAKAATTTIHEYLKQHPDIFMTDIKEPCFFTFKDEGDVEFTTGRKVRFITSLEKYKNLFYEDKKIRGESSTPYLYFYEKTIDNIKSLIPNYRQIKILIVLRNPIDRAYSQYMMKKRDLVEPLTFTEALDSERKRMQDNAHFDFFYADRGLYYKQVKAYFDNFDNVKVVLYEDLKNNMATVLNDLTDFLDVCNYHFKTISAQNISGISKSKVITNFLKKPSIIKAFLGKFLPKNMKTKLSASIQRMNTVKGPIITVADRKRLDQFYKEDLLMLGNLINKDLTHWYE